MAHTCKTGKPGFCKEWKFRARLEIYLDYRENNVTCYNVQWKKMGHSDMEDTYNLRNAEWSVHCFVCILNIISFNHIENCCFDLSTLSREVSVK